MKEHHFFYSENQERCFNLHSIYLSFTPPPGILLPSQILPESLILDLLGRPSKLRLPSSALSESQRWHFAPSHHLQHSQHSPPSSGTCRLSIKLHPTHPHKHKSTHTQPNTRIHPRYSLARTLCLDHNINSVVPNGLTETQMLIPGGKILDGCRISSPPPPTHTHTHTSLCAHVHAQLHFGIIRIARSWMVDSSFEASRTYFLFGSFFFSIEWSKNRKIPRT